MVQMHVSPLGVARLRRLRREGFLMLPPGYLGGHLLERAQAALPELLAQEGPQRVLERDGRTVRSVYGVHRSSEAIAELLHEPDLLGVARQVLGDDVYVHQSKVNVKAPLAGDQWEWHQDYVYWLHEDGLQRPDLLNVAILLDDVTEFNGPLTFIPRSHTRGVLAGHDRSGMPLGYEDAPAWVSTLTADERFRVEPHLIEELARTSGLVSPKGRAGSVLLFHPNVLHASAPNLSPFRRAMLMFVFNSTSNLAAPDRSARPSFLAEPHPTALLPNRVPA